MTFDLPTLYVIAALGLVIAGVLQLIPYLFARPEKAAILWASGHLTMGVANVAVVMHGHFPAFRRGIVPSFAHIVAYGLILEGMRSVGGFRKGRMPVVLAVVVCLLPLLMATTAPPSFRNGYMNVVRAGWDLSAAVAAIEIARRDRLASGWTTAFLFGATVPFFLGRSWLAWQGQLGSDTLGGQRGPAVWMAAAAISFVIFRGFCLSQMIAESGRKALLTRALHDPLTGAFNRSALNEIGPSLRQGTSAIMIDLDRFKALNDSKGHVAGDQALCLVAAICAAVIGRRGSVVRMGGDEFLCVLPVTGFNEASSFAACIGERYAREMKAAIGAGPRCSLSIGVARGEAGESLNDLLRHADRAMYRAKALRVGIRPTESIAPALTAA